ncbi:MAG: septation protein SpoVG [Deltaproteobacteria bacterium RIFCSPLOWO2_02_FULL_44_10]|nr:MAG: septation protein SpoVG [Deltaproteobacteria bacterium RIFCSPHIGHO2_02_FULL_44_16]OGQ47088.1 MAG: septation protein SpoVG [Deltaproteobacteria bacterium RIFCSPLOWO2_02_FULL_44_10]
MNITDVHIFPVNEGKLKAFATITIDGSFVIRDVKVIEGHKGLFIAMPSKQRKDGTFRDIVHPIDDRIRDAITEKILAAYKQTVVT